MFVSRLRNLLLRPLLAIDGESWGHLLHELEQRGEGARESGAFLLGHARGRMRPARVLRAVYYDDLDKRSLTGGISFSGSAYGRLWDRCAEEGLAVVADVHTHPGRTVGQSSVDREHPMLAKPGHVALIVPNFAQTSVSARDVGVHEYLGDGQWRSAVGSAAAKRLRIGGQH